MRILSMLHFAEATLGAGAFQTVMLLQSFQRLSGYAKYLKTESTLPAGMGKRIWSHVRI